MALRGEVKFSGALQQQHNGQLFSGGRKVARVAPPPTTTLLLSLTILWGCQFVVPLALVTWVIV